jgi:hypothetical protein
MRADPSPRSERLIADLRRELRPLGRRARRRALAEARDHLLSAIELGVDEGLGAGEAEARAVARFGDPSEIAARLCAVRPRRFRRVVPALLGAAAITGVFALAAGPVADELAPYRAAAAVVTSPSEHDCAAAFDLPANDAVRARVSAAKVLRLEIFATTVPSCLIKFQLPAQAVLTVQAAWKYDTAVGWRSSVNPHGLVGGTNGHWHAGLVTATGSFASVHYSHGPSPTVSSCLDAWNAAPPSLPASVLRSRPALVSAFNGGVTFGAIGGTTQKPIAGNACTVDIVESTRDVVAIAGSWAAGQASSWRRPTRQDGLIAGTAPNAELGADGRLTPRAVPAIQLPSTGSATPPKISHEIGPTGWAGGFHLHETLAQAIARFGHPSSETPLGLVCQMSWPGLHVTVQFDSPCGSRPGMAMSISGASTWSTTKGLHVGAPESDVERLYPGATDTTSSAGVTTYFLVPRSGNAGGALALTAQTTLGQVSSITVAVGSNTFGVSWG